MTAFDIDHDGYLEVNEQLYQAVGNLNDILGNLNTALAQIPEAVRGNAEEIWQDLQTAWNKAAQDMNTKLNANTLASFNTHEIFKNGDQHATRIMLQS